MTDSELLALCVQLEAMSRAEHDDLSIAADAAAAIRELIHDRSLLQQGHSSVLRSLRNLRAECREQIATAWLDGATSGKHVSEKYRAVLAEEAKGYADGVLGENKQEATK